MPRATHLLWVDTSGDGRPLTGVFFLQAASGHGLSGIAQKGIRQLRGHEPGYRPVGLLLNQGPIDTGPLWLYRFEDDGQVMAWMTGKQPDAACPKAMLQRFVWA